MQEANREAPIVGKEVSDVDPNLRVIVGKESQNLENLVSLLPVNFRALILTFILCIAAEPALAARFTVFRVRPGEERTEALAVSSNGTVVVGTAYDGEVRPRAVHWTPHRRRMDLGTLGSNYSYSGGMSSDGSVVVGGAINSNGIERAFRWTQADGMVDLGSEPGQRSVARGISGDGQVIVGAVADPDGEDYPFRWTATEGIELPGARRGAAYAANQDGSIIVGFDLDTNNRPRAFRWSAIDGLRELDAVGGDSSQATGISPDGSVIVGTALRPSLGFRAFRWTATNGVEDLGVLPDAAHSFAGTMSADGARIAGLMYTPEYEGTAALWTPETGWLDLNRVFRAFLPPRAHLISAEITSNGRWIVGTVRTKRRGGRGIRDQGYILDTKLPPRVWRQLTEQ